MDESGDKKERHIVAYSVPSIAASLEAAATISGCSLESSQAPTIDDLMRAQDLLARLGLYFVDYEYFRDPFTNISTLLNESIIQLRRRQFRQKEQLPRLNSQQLDKLRREFNALRNALGTAVDPELRERFLAATDLVAASGADDATPRLDAATELQQLRVSLDESNPFTPFLDGYLAYIEEVFQDVENGTCLVGGGFVSACYMFCSLTGSSLAAEQSGNIADFVSAFSVEAEGGSVYLSFAKELHSVNVGAAAGLFGLGVPAPVLALELHGSRADFFVTPTTPAKFPANALPVSASQLDSLVAAKLAERDITYPLEAPTVAVATQHPDRPRRAPKWGKLHTVPNTDEEPKPTTVLLGSCFGGSRGREVREAFAGRPNAVGFGDQLQAGNEWNEPVGHDFSAYLARLSAGEPLAEVLSDLDLELTQFLALTNSHIQHFIEDIGLAIVDIARDLGISLSEVDAETRFQIENARVTNGLAILRGAFPAQDVGFLTRLAQCASVVDAISKPNSLVNEFFTHAHPPTGLNMRSVYEDQAYKAAVQERRFGQVSLGRGTISASDGSWAKEYLSKINETASPFFAGFSDNHEISLNGLLRTYFAETKPFTLADLATLIEQTSSSELLARWLVDAGIDADSLDPFGTRRDVVRNALDQVRKIVDGSEHIADTATSVCRQALKSRRYNKIERAAQRGLVECFEPDIFPELSWWTFNWKLSNIFHKPDWRSLSTTIRGSLAEHFALIVQHEIETMCNSSVSFAIKFDETHPDGAPVTLPGSESFPATIKQLRGAPTLKPAGETVTGTGALTASLSLLPHQIGSSAVS